MQTRHYISIRSVVDRIMALALLLALLPAFIVISIMILVNMGRPVLFTQQRIGLNGKAFRILKFRTMVVDAEALGKGYMPKELNLVPPLGAILRPCAPVTGHESSLAAAARYPPAFPDGVSVG